MKNLYTKKEIYKLHRLYRGWLPVRNINLGGGSLYKMYCRSCRMANKRVDELEVCPICKTRLVRVAPRSRVPRKLASKSKWDAFEKRFCKNICP